MYAKREKDIKKKTEEKKVITFDLETTFKNKTEFFHTMWKDIALKNNVYIK